MASGYSDLSEISKNRSAYGLAQKPPKINLLNERPRRESLIEQQLTTKITRPIMYNQQSTSNYGHQQLQQVSSQQQPELANVSWRSLNTSQAYQEARPLEISQPQVSSGPSVSYTTNRYGDGAGVTTKVVKTTTTTTTTAAAATRDNDHWAHPPMNQHQQYQQIGRTTTTSAPGSSMATAEAYTQMVNDLTEKEEKLKREMAYLNQQLSPWARPRQIREPRREPPPRSPRSENRWVRECPSGPSSRPNSRASSTRSTTEADLMEKAAKLLQDVEELERKPLKTQEILIESGAAPKPTSKSSSPEVSGVHRAIIKVPNVEKDNKSPLPFAFDNFSTLGIRGNIASVGAAPPETPYPPIFPQVKRTPSPMQRRWIDGGFVDSDNDDVSDKNVLGAFGGRN